PAQALNRVRLIQRALAVGFTLDELARILNVRDRGGAPCREVRRLAAEKLSDIETRLSELISLRDELRIILQDWDTRLENVSAGERAALLETLAASKPAENRKRSLPASTWRQRKK